MAGEEGEGLSSKIAKEVMEALQKQAESGEKEKKVKVKKMSNGKKKKNYVLVIVLKNNGNLDMKHLQIKDDLIYLKESDTFHSATTNYVGYYKNIPCMILPEWDLKPLSRDDLMEKAEGGRYANPQSVIIHNCERAFGLLKNKGKGFGGNKTIWLIIGGAIVAYMVYQAVIGGG